MKGVVVKSVGDLYNVKINNSIIRCKYRKKNKLNNKTEPHEYGRKTKLTPLQRLIKKFKN